MEIFFEKYTNIQKFIVDYRQYKIEDKFHDFTSFKKTIQIEQYIVHKCTNTKKGKIIYIYIFRENSKYLKTTSQFKRLMDKIPEEPTDVIIISKNELSVYINKALLKYNHIRIYNYMHKYFSIELAVGPLCSKHTILSNNEVKLLCSRDLIIHPLSLPSISINDPQNIWIGGELGQIIKIESISEITGKTIRYRIVSPNSGKMINIQNMKQKIQDNDDNDDNDDIDYKSNEIYVKPNDEEIKDSKEPIEDLSEYIDVDDEEEDEEDTDE